ncbi:MAG TPA: GDP-mannose 4,6-dehydratase [Thermoanaerobaculia bacterium]|nr:GDP-mannose 4,6-dehydratase [Thermoanaerobaculia bacterium]
MRVLLTGGSGFVGSHLVAHLVAAGDEVTALAGPDAGLPAGVARPVVDLADRAGLAAALEGADPEVVIHLAGLAHVGSSWQQLAEYFQVNVLGTENVLAAAVGRRVVLASSGEVYGVVPEDEQPIQEDRPLAPASPYALTKAAAERLTVREGGVVARLFNLVGPGQSATFALPAFARQLAAIAAGEAEPQLKVGNLTPRRDFLHVADGARALRVLAEKGAPGEAYNIASGQALSIEEALHLLTRIAGVEAEVTIDPERFRPADIPLLTGDNARLTALGWHQELSLGQALEDLWHSLERPS